MIEVYRLAYVCVIVGMLGMASTHSDPRFAWAIFLLALANALFLYRWKNERLLWSVGFII